VNEDFQDMLAALLASGARFLVVGAHALAVHGVLRATGDLDVWVLPELAADRSHGSGEERYYCFGWVEGGVLTVRFTYRADVIRIFGAGDWRKGRQVYERENQVHRRTTGQTRGRS
jgi:hypothetical protein